MTTELIGEDGKVTAIKCVKVDDTMQAIEGSDFELPADLVLLAMGFVHPVHEGMIERWVWKKTGAAMSPPTRPPIRHRRIKSSPVAICAAVNRWLCGPSVRVANAPVVDFCLMGETALPR